MSWNAEKFGSLKIKVLATMKKKCYSVDTIEQVQRTENIHHTDSTLLVDLYMLAFAYRKIMNAITHAYFCTVRERSS